MDIWQGPKYAYEKPQELSFNSFQPSVDLHVETSHLFCFGKQMTGFYVKPNTGLK